MRRAFERLGGLFEAIGYHAERHSNPRNEDPVTLYSRRAARYIAVLAVIFGLILPIVYLVQLDRPQLLLAVPFSVGVIVTVATAGRARTPNRRFGRTMFALLLLALTFTMIFLVYK